MPEGAYRWFVYAELALALVTFVGLLFVVAPYGGRHGRGGWGPTFPARVAWIVMEAPAPVLFVVFFLLGSRRAQLVPLVLLALWLVHYVYRAFVYPFLMRSGSRMPVLVMALAIAFNTLNAWVNARWISEYGTYPVSWLADPRFWIGVALFAGGLTLNARSDRTLRRLKR
ncbi:MAG TPA: 3-oxo-5-alpha-steroid 4-dehydrogenase, partial [Microbacterium sp.]|nr:3-oxo-5-alpha-steroid 4-dehydrogenase [Microbacterium sp.]